MKKKNGQIRVSVNFRNLNKACLKDEFPLPHVDILVDSTAGHQMYSFMDGSMVITRSKWHQKMQKRQLSEHPWKFFSIR